MNEIQKVLGIDISKAFDSLPRSKLLNVLEQVFGKDCDIIRMTHIILAISKIQIKYRNEYRQSFESNKEVPVEDLVSPHLFIIYLQAIINEILSENNHLNFLVLIYADDEDLIHQLLNHK